MIDLVRCPACGRKPIVLADDSYGNCQIFCNCEFEPLVQEKVGELDRAAERWNQGEYDD